MTLEAFVYCWTDKLTNKLYVGSHKGSIDDGYVCSSKWMMEEYNKRPDDFSRQIVACGSFTDIRKLEAVILQSVNAKLDEQFYNKHNGDGNFYLKAHTQKTRNKIAAAKIGCSRPDLSERNKRGPSQKQIENQVKTKREKGLYLSHNNPMYGKKHSEKALQQMSEKKLGENNPNYGKKFSNEIRLKQSEARKKYWEHKRKEAL